jgi:hypothetical protein
MLSNNIQLRRESYKEGSAPLLLNEITVQELRVAFRMVWLSTTAAVPCCLWRRTSPPGSGEALELNLMAEDLDHGWRASVALIVALPCPSRARSSSARVQ